MQIHKLHDQQLLTATKSLVEREREIVTSVIRHLREIDRRRLFSDLGYQSLFEYAVKELNYSESEAANRLNAMRLIKEIPAVEKIIASGELSLTNASQAQRAFRKREKAITLSKHNKIEVLSSLRNKSTREGQKVLLEFDPHNVDNRLFEKERQVTADASEVRFLMDDELKKQLDHVRALLGSKAIDMGYAELFAEMAKLSVSKLSEKKFGKKRARTDEAKKESVTSARKLDNKLNSTNSKNARYVSKRLTHAVWLRDEGKCKKCGGVRNLNIDHVRPIGRGGQTTLENIRLLCFSCNQRQAIKVFGVAHQDKYRQTLE